MNRYEKTWSQGRVKVNSFSEMFFNKSYSAKYFNVKLGQNILRKLVLYSQYFEISKYRFVLLFSFEVKTIYWIGFTSRSGE